MTRLCDFTSQEVSSNDGKECSKHTTVEARGDDTYEREGSGFQQGGIDRHLRNGVEEIG